MQTFLVKYYNIGINYIPLAQPTLTYLPNIREKKGKAS